MPTGDKLFAEPSDPVAWGVRLYAETVRKVVLEAALEVSQTVRKVERAIKD
jgi:hypothetical protein